MVARCGIHTWLRTRWTLKECRNLPSDLLHISGTETIKTSLSYSKFLHWKREDLNLNLASCSFKIVHNLCHFSTVPELRGGLAGLRNSHPLQLKLPLAHTNAYHYSFFPHTMSAWNSLDNPYITTNNYVAVMKHLRSN